MYDLNDFTDFDRCILVGGTGSIRFEAAMEAFEATRVREKKEALENRLKPFEIPDSDKQTVRMVR